MGFIIGNKEVFLEQTLHTSAQLFSKGMFPTVKLIDVFHSNTQSCIYPSIFLSIWSIVLYCDPWTLKIHYIIFLT